MDTIALVLPKGRAQRDLKEAVDRADAGGRTKMPIAEPFAEAWLLDARTGIGLDDPSWMEDH